MGRSPLFRIGILVAAFVASVSCESGSSSVKRHVSPRPRLVDLLGDTAGDLPPAAPTPEPPKQDACEGTVRFIRLKYAGGSWDEDMKRHSGSNMLREFGKLTGIPVAPEAEVKSIRELAQFKKGKAPAFVYVTGSGGIRMSGGEVKILRKYLTEQGGMIFADNGGGAFNQHFRAMMAKVLDGVEWKWVDLPNDHLVYRAHFLMNGAPPLWHHSGYRALGIVYEGRLICFYHQGDIGDAWKDEHSGAPADVVEWAYKCGTNVMIFAVDQYNEFLHAAGNDSGIAPRKEGGL